MVSVGGKDGTHGSGAQVKYIRKRRPPLCYTNWCRQVRGTADEDYRRLRNPEKAELQLALLKEQGWLCAYTMRRVEQTSSHIEHFKPESICRADEVGSDLRYTNLLACFPRGDMESKYRYGARQKDDWWEEDGKQLISPLQNNCETRFRFNIDGEIDAVARFQNALTTIRVLRLDHGSLTDDRKRAIQEFIFGASGAEPLSIGQTNQAIAVICDANGDGYFHEFCVAIRDSLSMHLGNLRKIARRKKLVRRRIAGKK